MSILLTIHSIVRWLVTLAALALIIRLVIGLVKKQSFDKNTTALTSAFSGLMDAQMLLGLLYLIIDGLAKTGFPLYRWEHAVTMFFAVVVAHLPAMWKKQTDEVRMRNTLIAVCGSLVLVFIGVYFLGSARWLHITGLF